MVHMSFILVLKSLRQKDHEWKFASAEMWERMRERDRDEEVGREKRERENEKSFTERNILEYVLNFCLL